jgi:AcrR family transcriptional regulator
MPEPTGQRGRPRDSTVDRRVLDAATQILELDGYAGLSMETLADMAGVAKTTLYRRWPSKAHLVIDLVADLQRTIDVQGTGNIRNDLVTLVRGIAAALRAAGPVLVSDLVTASNRDPEATAGIRELFASRRQAAITVLRAAQERGELRADSDPAVLVDQLVGPLYYRLLITGDPIDQEYANQLVASVLGPHLRAT